MRMNRIVPACLIGLMFSSAAWAAWMPDASDDDLALWLDASAAGSVRTGELPTDLYWSTTIGDNLPDADFGDPVSVWRDLRTPGPSNTANTVNNHLFYNANRTDPDLSTRPIYIEKGFRVGAEWKPALRFDGINDRLITTDGAQPVLNDEHTILIVMQVDSSMTAGTNGGLTYTRYGSANKTKVEVSVYNSVAGPVVRMIEPGGVDTWSSSTIEELYTPQVIAVRRVDDGTNFITEAYVLDAPTAPWLSLSVANSNTISPEDADKGFRFGWHQSSDQSFKGIVGEIIVYNRALSDDELADTMRYLETKWMPEPGSAALLGGVATGLLLRRQRGQRH